MRYFRRLPPFLKMVCSIGLVCSVSTLVIIVVQVAIFVMAHMGGQLGLSHESVIATRYRWLVIAIDLSMFSIVSGAATNAYVKRFDLVPPNPLPLDSLRAQALAVLLPAVAPLCAIALALTISPSSDWFGLVYGVSVFGAMGALASVTVAAASAGSFVRIG